MEQIKKYFLVVLALLPSMLLWSAQTAQTGNQNVERTPEDYADMVMIGVVGLLLLLGALIAIWRWQKSRF